MSLKPVRLLHDSLLRTVHEGTDRVALVTGKERYSYDELRQKSISLATFFADNGIERGDRVVIYTGNTWECIVALYGALIAGGAFVIANHQTKSVKLAHIVEDCRARFIVVSSALLGEAGLALNTCESLEKVLVAGDTAAASEVCQSGSPAI